MERHKRQRARSIAPPETRSSFNQYHSSRFEGEFSLTHKPPTNARKAKRAARYAVRAVGAKKVKVKRIFRTLLSRAQQDTNTRPRTDLFSAAIRIYIFYGSFIISYISHELATCEYNFRNFTQIYTRATQSERGRKKSKRNKLFTGYNWLYHRKLSKLTIKLLKRFHLIIGEPSMNIIVGLSWCKKKSVFRPCKSLERKRSTIS